MTMTMRKRTLSLQSAGAALLLIAAAAAPAVAQRDACDAACIQAKVDRHLLLMGEFGNEEAMTASMRDLVAIGTPVVPVVVDTYDAWTRLEEPDPLEDERPAEMRWRAVYLLGDLRMRDGVRALYDIAKTPMPDPRLDEDAFADEMRIHLRAVAGLETLGAIDELRDLYADGGVLRNATAASLFVLGENVGGVRRIDARRALAEETVDPRIINPTPPARRDIPGSRTSPPRQPNQ